MVRNWNYLLRIGALATSAVWQLGAVECALAEPLVIKDYGGGRSSGVPTKAALLREYQSRAPEATAPVANPFPIVSRLRAGELSATIALPVAVPRAFFLIGTDALSLQWVQRNKQYLLSARATGYITNIDNENEFMRWQEALSPLSISPLPFDDLAQELKIPVYPVLIENKSIRQ